MKAFVIGLCVILAAGAFFLAQGAPAYVGSDTCSQCHLSKYNDFRVSGHPYKLRPASVAKVWPTPLPQGYTWDEISYVIGGYRWKIRFMDKNGYIITDAKGTSGKTQYNLATGEWVDYHAGEQKAYDCGSCHTTGYSSSGNQDGLPGIVGTWAFPGIQCEACHGPGSDHAGAPSPANITVDDSAALCGGCHVRGDPASIPASGGFVRHHEQYNELLQSPHKNLDCVDCHDPHKKADFSIHTECTDCHDEMDTTAAFKGLGRKHLAMGVECEDCHMPNAAKSAVAENKFKGDVKSHLFEISKDKNHELFSADGGTATGPLTAEFSCLGCHVNIQAKFEAKGKPEKAIAWARKSVKKIHKSHK